MLIMKPQGLSLCVWKQGSAENVAKPTNKLKVKHKTLGNLIVCYLNNH